MSEIKNGGPAFPEVYSTDGTCVDSVHGLTKRDWFAGLALQAILIANPQAAVDRMMRQASVSAAYKYADEMLEQRDKVRQ